MPVTRGTKSVTKVVRLLTDPIPQLVSLVEHGANQTPFKVVKHAEIERDLKEDTDMAGVRTRSVKDAGKADLHKMLFKSEHYKDEAAVKAYLDDNSYSNFVITKSAAGDFEVAGHAADEFEGDIKMIPATKGITLWAGKLKAEPVQESTTKAKAAPESVIKTTLIKIGEDTTQDVVNKWSGWRAEYSEATTLKDAIDSGADGIPPGLWEVNSAFYAALKNILSGTGDDKAAAVKGLTDEFGAFIIALDTLFSAETDAATRSLLQKASTRITVTVSEDDKKAKDATAATGGSEPANKAKVTAEDGEGKVTAETGSGEGGKPPAGDDTAKDGKDGEGAGKEPAEPAKKNTGKAEGDGEGEPSSVTKAITDALSPLTTAMAGLVEVVKGVQTSTAERLDTLSESVTKTGERLDAIDKDRAQTRKSTDVEEPRTATQDASRPASVSKSTRNAFGMRRRD